MVGWDLCPPGPHSKIRLIEQPPSGEFLKAKMGEEKWGALDPRPLTFHQEVTYTTTAHISLAKVSHVTKPNFKGTGEIVSLYEMFMEIWKTTTQVSLLEKEWMNEDRHIQQMQISINKNIMLIQVLNVFQTKMYFKILTQ